MHKDISVAVATRHRPFPLRAFVHSLESTVDHLEDDAPFLTVLYDSPDWAAPDCDIRYKPRQDIVVPSKSGLAELWNWCVMLAPTDWVLICNDDITFNDGWIEYLEQQIATDKYDMIHLFHYGGMCIHKRLILKLGWFDERFRGGGFEDNDYQLRIYEAGLKHRVDMSHGFTHMDGKVEVGHFMNHTKHIYSQKNNWSGCNNYQWIQEKWAGAINWRSPVYRRHKEIDWHPSYTAKYSEKYGPREWDAIANKSIAIKQEVRH